MRPGHRGGCLFPHLLERGGRTRGGTGSPGLQPLATRLSSSRTLSSGQSWRILERMYSWASGRPSLKKSPGVKARCDEPVGDTRSAPPAPPEVPCPQPRNVQVLTLGPRARLPPGRPRRSECQHGQGCWCAGSHLHTRPRTPPPRVSQGFPALARGQLLCPPSGGRGHVRTPTWAIARPHLPRTLTVTASSATATAADTPSP